MSIMPYRSLPRVLRQMIEDEKTSDQSFMDECKRTKYSNAVASSARWHFNNRSERGYIK